MEETFAQLIAPMGCFATRKGRAQTQHETTGYVDTRSAVSAHIALAKLQKEIASGEYTTTMLKARCECFATRHAWRSAWPVSRQEIVGVALLDLLRREPLTSTDRVMALVQQYSQKKERLCQKQ